MKVRGAIAAGLSGFLLAATGAAAAGPTASDLSWTMNGQTVHLYQLRGHYVVLNFFATWCPACREEQQAILSAAHEYAAKDVTFVGIDVGDESVKTVTDYAEHNAVDYPLVVDSESILNSEYGITALPTTIVVDPQGRIVKRVVGAMEYQDVASTLNGLIAADP